MEEPMRMTTKEQPKKLLEWENPLIEVKTTNQSRNHN